MVYKKNVYVLSLVLLMLLCSALGVIASGGTPVPEKPSFDFSVYNGKNVGILSGSWFDKLMLEKAPDANLLYFTSPSDEALALSSGKIDAFVEEEPTAKQVVRAMPGLTYITTPMARTSYAFVFAKGSQALCDDFSAVIREMWADGTIDACAKRWIDGDPEAAGMPDIELTGENGTVRMAISPTSMPFVFVRNDEIMGYDVEIVTRICQKLGYKLEFFSADFSALIPGVVSGKADLAAGAITVTQERKQSVLFCEPNYEGSVSLLVRTGDMPKGGSFLSSIGGSLYKTFVVESRWKMLLSGLGITILLSVLSGIFGAVLGFLLCMMRRSPARLFNIPARVFIRLIQGTPVVVFLMILYYVLFPGNTPALLVAVVGFSINFAAYVSEMMRSGIDAVDCGQLEAAAAIGLGRVKTFTKITFPQAAKHFLPVLKGEFISMVKMTSVVGYIAIQDLTKASDIIRSRTYEAFFPLIITAMLYFILAYLLSSLLTLIEVRIDPKHRKRAIKGVSIR